MDIESSFNELIKRVRSGDEFAAADLVRLYEPEIRREVKFLLRDQSLRRHFDSMDICQSVLGSFFIRASLGQYDLERPEQLLRLLVSMTRNKLTDAVRRQSTMSRSTRREIHGEPVDLVARDISPSQVVSRRELVNEFQKRFSAEERRLVELRDLGRQWTEIAAELGGTAEARRKQLARAVGRIAHDLGLDELDDD